MSSKKIFDQNVKKKKIKIPIFNNKLVNKKVNLQLNY